MGIHLGVSYLLYEFARYPYSQGDGESKNPQHHPCSKHEIGPPEQVFGMSYVDDVMKALCRDNNKGAQDQYGEQCKRYFRWG